jgi:hypothetical protein
MPVLIEQFVKLKCMDGVEREGEFKAQNLVAVYDSVENCTQFGTPVSQRLRTTVTCDAKNCVNGRVNEDLITLPMSITFDDDGSGSEKNVEEVRQIVIVADYAGDKKVYCCAECAAGAIRKKHKVNNVVEFPRTKLVSNKENK